MNGLTGDALKEALDHDVARKERERKPILPPKRTKPFKGFTFQQLVERVAAERDITKREAEATIRCTFTCIADVVTHGGRALIPDFGTYFTVTRAARNVRDLQTGQIIKLPGMTSVGFRCSKNLKR